MRAERWLLGATPVVAVAAVAVGLRVGAGSSVRAAVVFGAPASGAGTGLAWQVVAFEEDRGVRRPLSRTRLDVTARGGGRDARWAGETNEDGAAEVLIPLPSADGLRVEVRANGELIAGGVASVPSAIARVPPGPAWARFARREGAIALDVAVLGQRVASGFPASIWVRATDAASRAPLAGVAIEPEPDAALSTAKSGVLTDARGWGHIVATPVGYGVALVLHARSTDGRAGDWAGALFASPGAAEIVARDRYAPDEPPTFDVVMPNVRTIAYVEIDDARGRAWGATVPLGTSDSALPRARVVAPTLAPGLYWAVASGDAAAGAELGPGTIVRPFFVASSDEAALGFGLDEACRSPRDPSEAPRVVGVCLALAGATAVPRWTALDGFAAQHARDAHRRARGLAIALGAIAVALVLETVLLLRAARTSAWMREAVAEGSLRSEARARRAGAVGVALLVALLGFLLLAAFLARAA